MRATLEWSSELERHFAAMGGVEGYLAKARHLLRCESSLPMGTSLPPRGHDLREQRFEKILAGIAALHEVCEIYPIGGLASRLNLKDAKGEPLPAAALPFLGRSLLEGLVRDVQAREYLYFKLFDKKVVTPLALMISSEQKMARVIRGILEEKNWFGRPKESFFIFAQPSVPVVSNKGEWIEGEFEPGGHGALWSCALQEGLFKWLAKRGRTRALVRQINNPIGSIDGGLLALLGCGVQTQKAMGFASCARAPGAQEGVLIHHQDEKGHRILNVEYTEFHEEQDLSSYPTNTNLIYIDLKQILPFIQKEPHPGLILNMKGKKRGRIESRMQSLSDILISKTEEELPTFVTFNDRIKTISVTKKQGEETFETPKGAFQDLMRNMRNLLDVPEEISFLFTYHPALGPLFEIIKQKVRDVRFAQLSELKVEIAELAIEGLDLEGSLLIEESILGQGRCLLKNVHVRNRGIDPKGDNCYWQQKIARNEKLSIRLEGKSEFFAQNVCIEGDREIVVPDGWRYTLTQDSLSKEKNQDVSWSWDLELGSRGMQCVLQKSF